MQPTLLWVMILLGFSLPISTSVISILACLALLCWILEGRFKNRLFEIWNNPVCKALLAYFMVMVIALLWSDNLADGISFIQKRWKIMLMPVFMTAVVYGKREWYFWGFLAGMTVAMTLTYLAWFGLLQYADVTADHITKKTFHVVYNPLLAFAIYWLAHELSWGKIKKKWKLAGWFLLFIMIFNMFITEGRTGQLVFFVLFAVFLFQLLRRNLIKASGVVAIILPLLFITGYNLSPQFKNRIDLAKSEIQQFEQNPNTSVGFRLLYWQNSIEIIKENIFLGVGTGDFEHEYAKVNKRLSPNSKPTDNPHNQYFLVTTNFGIVGLIIFLSIFIVQLWAGYQRQDQLSRVRIAFPIFFLVIMLTESYLVVYETGFFFSLFTAVLYKMPPTAQEHSIGQ